MGKTQGLRKDSTPAKSATIIAGNRPASIKVIPNIEKALVHFNALVTGAEDHIFVDKSQSTP